MSDQRPAFRFRLPWLLPSAPAPSPAPAPPPAARPTNDIQIPAQPTTTTPVVRPPFRPAGVAPPLPPPPPPQVQAPPPRTESQPSSPSRVGAQTRISSQPASPARAAAQAQATSQPSPPPPPPPPRAESQPSSPSRIGAQTRISSQSSSPSRAATQARASSQPPPPPPPPPPQVQEPPPSTESQSASSPSRVGAQSRISSQPASPARAAAHAQAASQPPPPPPSPPQVKEPSRTAQLTSPSRLGAQTRVPSQPSSPAKDTSQASKSRVVSLPQSPARVVPPPQATSKPSSPARPTTRAASQAASLSRTAPQPRVGSQLSSPSRTTPQPQPPPQTASQPRSPSRLGDQPKSEPVAQPPSPPKTVTQPPRISAMPLAPLLVSEKESSKPVVSQPEGLEVQPDIKQLKELDAKLPQTKDEKEVEKASFEPKKNAVIDLLTEASSRLKAKMKEQSTFAFQENQETLETKETVPTPNFSEKQTKYAISHPKDRNPLIESRQKPAISSGQRVPLHKEIRDDISKFVNKMAIGHTKHNMDEKPVSVITIAGDNRGAMMHLGSDSSSKRERTVHIHRAYKLNPDESTEATSDGEGSSKGQRRPKDKEEETKKSYINSNAQGINNSVVFNSSITERNPGVHLVVSHNLKEPIKSNDRIDQSLSRAEMNLTPSQKLTYEPTIRRRCLRGLFMEPSDSDTDNHEKPRRHGCRYACEEKSKDNNIDVL